MEKSEFRVLIKHYFLRKKSITQTKAKLDKYYGDSAPSISMVKKWFTEFRCGRTSTEDAKRSGRPVEVSTSETAEKIHDMVLADRRLKVREIVEAIGISHGSVVSILNDHLGMRKLSARWVPRLLTIDDKRKRVTISQKCLALFNRNINEFLRRFVTVDETWIHHNTPETKQQSKQWVSRGESAPKKAKVGLSANKVMATVFWDARGIIHIDYLQKGKTINGEYYSNLLGRFDEALKEKRPHLAKKKVLFHQDNARVHTCAVSMGKIDELGYELLPHPAYSPDLAPCDYFLFPNLKKWLGGKRFASNDEVISQTNAYFKDLDKTYFSEGIKKLEKRWAKCIELKGDYVEK
ncbi:histone-lysine N-methyltransferase SETMAR-like [Spodoptera litura]|uniref:Histone-lysine N-methyltransferase SETMAR-like n=1 Tax=Spodoptera litura TaxID=69820 RepID=A0A9J7IRW6_SPOLT|nr:histone-lysine N-methyltransferase SETMAR-like [Spodoptera litura]